MRSAVLLAIKLEPGDKEGAAETRHVLFDKSNNAVHVAPHSSVMLELTR